MPVPKYRTSSSKRDMRRSHHSLKAPGISVCGNCGSTVQPHSVCRECGHYRGMQVIEAKDSDLTWDGSGLDKGSEKTPSSEGQTE